MPIIQINSFTLIGINVIVFVVQKIIVDSNIKVEIIVFITLYKKNEFGILGT